MIKKMVKSTLMLSVMFLFFSLNTAKACEFEFEIQGDTKEVYAVGDEIVVKVIVTYTHKVCPIGIEKTKFEPDGLEILQTTKWKETSANVWERKVKLKVIGNENGKLIFSATRTCDKEGGSGSVSFKLKK